MPTPDNVDPNSCILNCDAGKPAPTQAPAPTGNQAPPSGQQQSATDRVTSDSTEGRTRTRAIEDLFECDPNAAPDQAVNAGLLSGGIPGPGTTKQGSMGDCWVLASFMGFQVSEAGRAALAKLVTANPNGGYDVRFGSDCRMFHVDKVFADGARQVNGSTGSKDQGVISVLEAAFRQTSTPAKYQMCAGWFAPEAQKVITGTFSEEYPDLSPMGHKMRDRLTKDADDVNSLIASGRSAVVSTRKDTSFITDVMTPSGLKSSTKVKLVGQHQYVVTKAAQDGVWIMNPWGPNNSGDGGGEVWVPVAQIEDSFSDFAISAPIPDVSGKSC
ncbi:C2 family cysteine protease [Tsukamurella paurometabola]|uniref:Calpain catalytic domain-containing protein n=1 Tax=Tsukamurella paurometabola TaxID=2061 RepID=A0ABS5NLI8_TSUPA|nr:C2 family cysteine protease [Tsukamurella paurometabola]MBS4104303.1 hypothetical protein [Tsukamurella paurometabola]